jgi:chemotaxis protein MotA
LTAFKAAFFVFSERKRDPNDMVSIMIKLCYICRRKGILALSKIRTRSAFLKKGCNLIADGSEEALFHKTMGIEGLSPRLIIEAPCSKLQGIFDRKER